MAVNNFHFHGPVQNLNIAPGNLDPDVLTAHEPMPAPKTQALEESGQLSVFDPPAEIVAAAEPTETVETPTKYPSGVAIKPQQPSDQRTEIRASSERNAFLMDFDEEFSLAHSEHAAAAQAASGRKVGYRNEIQLRASARQHEKNAKAAFGAACGACALTGCQIRNNYAKMERVHQSASSPRTGDQESRADWRSRILDDLAKSPKTVTPCLPPPKPKHPKKDS